MTFQDILNRNSKRGYWKAALAICYEEQPPPRPPFSSVSTVILCREGKTPRKPVLENQNENFPEHSPGGALSCYPLTNRGTPAPARIWKCRYNFASRRAKERKQGRETTSSKKLLRLFVWRQRVFTWDSKKVLKCGKNERYSLFLPRKNFYGIIKLQNKETTLFLYRFW